METLRCRQKQDEVTSGTLRCRQKQDEVTSGTLIVAPSGQKGFFYFDRVK